MIDAATVGAPDTAVGLFFARRTLHLTLFPIVAIGCASVAAIFSFHGPATQNYGFILQLC